MVAGVVVPASPPLSVPEVPVKEAEVKYLGWLLAEDRVTVRPLSTVPAWLAVTVIAPPVPALAVTPVPDPVMAAASAVATVCVVLD
jgi:hypothetical protein